MRLSKVNFFTCALAICLVVWFSISIFATFNVSDFLINQQLMQIPTTLSHSDSIKNKGQKVMKYSSVSIIGVGRNIEDKLPTFLIKVNELGAQFQFSQFIFVVGDSTDNSVTLLKNWEDDSKDSRVVLTVDSLGEVESVNGFAATALPREGRIAMARNLALRELRKRTQTDYVIVIDMDIVGWDLGGVQDSFGRSDVWDVACAHGILLHGIYRDTYALRALDINNNHHLSGEDHAVYNITEDQWKVNRAKLKVDKRLSLQFMDLARIRRYQDATRGSRVVEQQSLRPVRVDSCFGGLAIYKFSAMDGCEYRHRYQAPPHFLDCEHVLFNQCLTERNRARIVSNPNMKLWYGHSGLRDINFSKEISKLVLGDGK